MSRVCVSDHTVESGDRLAVGVQPRDEVRRRPDDLGRRRPALDATLELGRGEGFATTAHIVRSRSLQMQLSAWRTNYCQLHPRRHGGGLQVLRVVHTHLRPGRSRCSPAPAAVAPAPAVMTQ
jgi:hypothetical protein